MPRREIVLIGGSAGSIGNAAEILRGLSPKLKAAVLVIVHLRARQPSYLAETLQRAGPLRVERVKEGLAIENGRVYVGVPDRHVIVANRHFHLSRGPREGLHRPSINATFRSAAASYGEGVIGVLLSGMLDDGAAGLWEIVRHDGIAIVQDPEEATFNSMPLAALEGTPLHYTLRTKEMAPMLNDLVAGRVAPKRKRGSKKEEDVELFSGFTCPECRGPLYEKKTGPVEFRCRVGHAFSLPGLIEEASSTQERKMYEAVVALEEGADLAQLAERKSGNGQNRSLREEAKQLRYHAQALRKLIEERRFFYTG